MKLYNATQVCAELKITIWTLTNWYQWEKFALKNGELFERVLPVPTKNCNAMGKPRQWSEEQLAELKVFQSKIVRGRHGKMAKITNPQSRQAKNK